jgi:hypothetical protein
MTMIDEMIGTVRAAFSPGADAATKQQAASILRGLLTMLEGQSGAGPEGATAAPVAPDLLATIVENLRQFLPPDALTGMPRFRVPFIKAGE